MKNVKIVISIILILMLPLLIASVTAENPVTAESANVSGVTAAQELRGVWVATVSNINYPSVPSTDPEILKNEAITILDNAKSTGFNAIFLQVRPTADAFYKSKYFPWSRFLTGTQGQAPGNDFDPLEFWVNEAHKRGMELHAWINPYRVTKQGPGEPLPDPSTFAASNPARLNPSWIVKYNDGNYYFNPGIPDVRQLVMDGVLEIVNNYNIDGIHFDDYFYPGKDFNDNSTYQAYGNTFSNINDWRRNNVNILISDLSKAIKATGKNVAFGISPFGIWANKTKNILGSDTSGGESYYDHYADTYSWVKNGLLDYIAPQLYWNIGFSAADYGKLLTWWSNTVSGTNVKLYIGQAAYRENNSNTSSAWYGNYEIDRQLRMNAANTVVKGSIFFSYKSIMDNPALNAQIKAYYQQKDGMNTAIPINISRPSENIKVSYDKYYLNGSSDPAKPLYINGIPIEKRSPLGYFGVLMPLKEGPNIFTFSQDGSYTTRVIYRNSTSSAPSKMSAIEIISSSVFPQSQEYRTMGEKITLSCKAPAGSKVTVRLGGKTYTMKTSTSAKSSSALYPATYTYVYTIPKYTGTPRNIDLGAPIYTMNYKGKIKTRKAPANVGVIMKNSPFYAEIQKDVIDTYKTPSSGDGCAYELYKGMKDYITGMTGEFTRLSTGQWVRNSSVNSKNTNFRLFPSITNSVYTKGEVWDKIAFDMTSPSAAYATFDGTNLRLTISPMTNTLLPVLPDDSFFSAITVSSTDNVAVYTMRIKNDQQVEGYYVEKTDSGIVLNIKRHITATPGMLPLSGIKIMLDPGHGGNESGAIGPLGRSYPEKAINLNIALKLQSELQKLGAQVLMTRSDDTTMSLVDRLAASRNARPDMLISIHSNSADDDDDMSNIQGFSVHHREAIARSISQIIDENVIKSLGRFDREVNINNFYVVRGTWAPSFLIESGFVPNPVEFEWLTNETEQTKFAQSLAEAVVRYFSK